MNSGALCLLPWATTCALPLTSIKVSVSTLRQTDVDWSEEERAQLLETIEDSTDRLDAVVRNLLDASRLQIGIARCP